MNQGHEEDKRGYIFISNWPITTLPVCLVTGGDNLALSRPVEANTKYSEDNGAKNAVDGNRNSNYHSQVTDSPKWLRVDLGVIYSVNKIEIDHKFSKLRI